MSCFVLDNARLWIGDGTEYNGHVIIDGDHIEAVAEGRYRGNLEAIDLQGQALSPGLIDLMVLGGFGMSIMRDDARDIARQYLRHGVTSMQCCIGTLPWEGMEQVAMNVRRAQMQDDPDRARVIGLYLEGPFQEPRLTGGSLAEYALPPTLQNVDRILDKVGDILTMINISPGTVGDCEAVKRFCQTGVVVSMAHSDAPSQRVMACIDNGTSVLGHAWDNNSGLIGDSGVQQPTLEHVAMVDPRVRFIHLISDGIHVHPLMIKLILKCRGVESLCLVTDGNQRMGCADGPFTWDDGRQMYKAQGVCRVTGSNWLAGSATLLPQMFRNFVRFSNLPAHEAIRMVTHNPARSLELDRRIGMLASQRVADLVMWSDDLQVRRVWRAGRMCSQVDDYCEVLA